MSSIDKLANLFKERNNSYVINITTGTIMSVSPMKVKWGDSIILLEDDLVLSRTVKDGLLEIGDNVIMVPDNDYKKWYLLDKVG